MERGGSRANVATSAHPCLALTPRERPVFRRTSGTNRDAAASASRSRPRAPKPARCAVSDGEGSAKRSAGWTSGRERAHLRATEPSPGRGARALCSRRCVAPIVGASRREGLTRDARGGPMVPASRRRGGASRAAEARSRPPTPTDLLSGAAPNERMTRLPVSKTIPSPASKMHRATRRPIPAGASPPSQRRANDPGSPRRRATS